MKRKLLFALALLLSGVCNLWAQTDVTSTYITNADFESGNTFAQKKANAVSTSIPGWTVSEGGNYQYYTVGASGSNTPDNDSGFGKTVTAASGSKYVHIRHGWKGSSTEISQTLSSLPKGKFTLSLKHKGATPRSKSPTLKLSATPDGSSAIEASYSSYPTSLTRDNSTWTWDNNYGDWSVLSCDFELTEAKNTTIKIRFTDSNIQHTSNDEVIYDDVKLTYKNVNGTQLYFLIAQATAIDAKLGTLTSEIATAQGVYDGINDTPAYQETIDNAISTLQTAINTKVAAYEFNPAGDDISALYIWNNGFDIDINFSSSSSTATAANTVYPTFGWTPIVPGNCTGATMGYGYSGIINGSGNVTAPTQNAVGTTAGGALIICVGWSGQVTYKSLAKTFPAGSYRITYRAYNGNTKNTTAVEAIPLVGFVPTSGDSQINNATETFTNQAWSTHTYDFDLASDTEGQIQIGLQPTEHTNSFNAPELFIDEVTLTYFDPLKLAQIQWQEVHDALDALDATALPDAAEGAITTELAKTVPTTSVDDVNTAKAALQALIDSYDGIKAAYDKVKDLITFVTAEKTNSTGTKTTIEDAINASTANIETRTTAIDLTNDYNTLESARQTYVTSGAQPTENHVFDYTFKISNPSFEADGISTNSPTGWDIPNKGSDYGARPLGESGSTYYMSNADGSFVFNNWQSWWMTCQVSQELTSLPNGHYSLTAVVAGYDQSTTTLKANETATNQVTTGAANGILVTVNETIKDGKLTILAQSVGTSGNTFLKVDDFHLYYKGNAVDDATVNALIATMVEGKMNAEVASAQETAKDNLLANKTIDYYTALETAITAASASKDAYTQLKAELDKVPAGLGTTNVYTATSYATNYTNVLAGYDDETISTDDANAYAYGERVTGAMPAIMLSSWKVGETAALTDASLYMNAWSTEGNSDGSEMTTPFYEYWVADDNALATKTFTATVEGLTAGTSYLVTAKVRVRQQNEQEKADDDVTFQVNNGDVVNASDGTQSEIRPEMYYKTVRATGTADGEGKLAIKVVVKDGNHVSWLAFKDVHYSEVTTPTEEHKTALNNAISEAEAKTIGFEAGEYATYTNIDARKALAAAKAIDFEVNTDYEVVAATNALTSATWTVNAVEVNAVSNELFNDTEYGAAGWTRNVTWNNVSGGSYSIPAGTMTYGDVAYHEMPLKGNTVYKLTFGHRRWDNNNADNGGQVSVLNSNNQGLDLTAYSGTNSTTLQSGDYYFRTGAAGNYTFTVTATSGRLTFGNVIIKKATDGDLLLEDTETDAPSNGYYQTMSTTRTLKGGQWNGFSLPYSLTAEQLAASVLNGAMIKQFSSVAENVITMEDATAIVAGKPYLVKPVSDIANPSFNGVTVSNPEEIVEGTGDYTFQAHLYATDLATDGSVAYVSTTDSSIKKLTSGGIKGMRAIFNIPVPNSGNEVKALRINFGGDADGILSVDADGNIVENGAVFNLAGQRLSKLQKGINIVNGKKVLVK